MAVAIFVIVAALWCYSYYSTKRAWEAAEREASLDLPRWRMHELEEDRVQLADDENSALLVIGTRNQAIRAGAEAIDGNPKYEKFFEKLQPNMQLNEQQIKILRINLGKVPGSLTRLRKLKDLPNGRFPITINDDFLSTLLPDHQDMRLAGEWLTMDAMLRSQGKEHDLALESCQAALNVSRSAAQDPFWIAQLFRIPIRHLAVTALERSLAQGEPSDAALAAVQKQIESDLPENAMLVGLRGERAGAHLLFSNIRDGNLQPGWIAKAGLGDPVFDLLIKYTPGIVLKYYPDYLRQMNQLVEIAKLPPHEQAARFTKLEAELKHSKNPVTNMLLPKMSKIQLAENRSQAELRAAFVALACERFRMKHQQWPESLDELVNSKFIDQIPLDPFDGKPLRYGRTKGGVVIYSVGVDLTDNLGNVDRDRSILPGYDVGFRLWDVANRRRAPLPPLPIPDEDL